MNGWFGLIELVLVFGLVLGWAFWELYKTRSYKDGPKPGKKDDDPQ